ncbi:hypothetical protein, variant 2 [Blastomyces gilchristii SLH14081]|uniref:Uncharacterized protein n=1 Tax=Blastomyces gilchristii (strain SLH14081) TaxID=559298 RepID=A0A179UDD5_BLAGS|nr:uncharacterized protein BDBG_02084 [Blastomyces gilchristii SLH14081]XP_031576863.1 hypothetical protein, variant 1 [Blastomyces gilchristii SLH14081]XP_031576864.1 hypothetical protein, variant 2 [Blastomyces gilchristii SLH14081]OAT05743.1 hypothetical protein BDBG_02084 [Blastomyces gilchristii SLH14081]OAT05744.1 hypothetical protein, variant 1 [Blastomyces gilchristii SLH14081]OAT05745.1 hypothetical protein, variant 2 [Blastomyces gilchristii SLH14081]
MDKLPSETVGLIVRCLLQPENGRKAAKIASYAGISRAWQNAVELQTMRSIMVRSSSAEWEMFRQIFIGLRRRSILSELLYSHPTVPRCYQTGWPGALLPEMLEDCSIDRQQELDMDFELAVRNLFGFLREWEDEFVAANITHRAAPLTLRINPVWKPQTLLMLKFQGQESLPTLYRVKCLIIHSVHPTAFLKIANCLSNVTNVYYFVWTMNFSVLRTSIQDFRSSLSMALRKLSLPSLKSFHVGCSGRSLQNHNLDAPSWNGNHPIDLLSLSLALFMHVHHLTEIELRFYPWGLSPELFCPFSPSFPTSVTQPKPSWVNLERLMLTYGNLHPGGKWYLIGSPELAPFDLYEDSEDSEDSDNGSVLEYFECPPYQWRWLFCPRTFDPLVRAMSRAVLHMPRLRQLSFTLSWSGHLITEQSLHIEFLMPGETTAVQPCYDSIVAFDRQYVGWIRWYSWMIIVRPDDRDMGVVWQIPRDIRELWWDKVGVERRGLIAWGTKGPNAYERISASFSRNE